MDPQQTAILCARFLAGKIGQDIVALDIRGLIDFADFFVLCTGMNDRQIRSMTEELDREIKQHGVRKLGIEGKTEAKWVLFDLGDVIVHVFSAESRGFYDLEMLWGDAPRVAWEAPVAASPQPTSEAADTDT